MVHIGDDEEELSPHGPVIEAPIGQLNVDIGGLDEETQRFVLETHLENIGLVDFLGFELASLASVYSDYSRIPGVAGGCARVTAKMGDAGTYVTIFKSFIGIGILSLPYAVSLGGAVGGPVGLAFIGLVAHHGMQLILETSAGIPGRVVSFGGMAQKLCGRRAKVLVETSLVVTQLGICIAYVIFVTDNVCDVVCLETRGLACPGRVKACIAMLLLLQPLTWLRTLDVLVIPTLMSNLVLVGGLLWISFCSALQVSATPGPAASVRNFNWTDYPLFFGMAVFSFEGICLILPIKQAMTTPEKLPRQLQNTCIGLVVLYLSFGTLSYIAYGKNIDPMVTFNLPANKVSSFLRLFYCLGIFFSYPVQMSAVHSLNEAKYSCLKGPSRMLRRNMLRTCIVLLSGAIGMCVPNFGLFLGLLGSVACSLLAFVLPGLFHLRRIDRSSATRLGDAKDVSLMVFGIVAGAVSFVCTMQEIAAVMVSGNEGGKADAGGG